MCRETQNASFCVLVLTFCSIAQAGLSDPPVRNPSFESPGLGAGGTGQWADHADVWKLNANGWAYLEDGSWEIDAPDGANVMKLWSGAYLWQQIGTWSPDTVYEVGLWLGRGAATSSLEVELWGGGNPALLPTSNFGEIDATVGAVLIAGGTLTPTVAVGESEWMTLRLNTGTDFKLGDALWIRILSASNDGEATWVDMVTVAIPPNPALASVVAPLNEATDVPLDAVLLWTPGQYAVAHDVYLGTVYEQVDAASRGDPKGMLVGQGQAATSLDPAGLVTYGQTYYWRVDEVNAPPDSTVFKGSLWSFTTEPYAYPITPVQATASSSTKPETGPVNTINGSGLTGDKHSTTLNEMWLSGKTPQPSWIQYDFDQAYKLHQMWVWNSNQMTEPDIGYGAKEVTVETSTDGSTWTPLAGVPEFAQATGLSDYTANTIVDFGGVAAQFVRLTIRTNWGGLVAQKGLAEVRFFHIPVRARQPKPSDGAEGVAPDAGLDWRPGRVAARHEVHFGTDPNALALSKTVTDHQLALSDLGAQYATTYYWRVDEVNDAATPAVWAGPVWSFSTPPYGTVDDFEAYNDRCSRVYYAWKGGAGNSENVDCGTPAYSGNGTGSIVGNDNSPYAEQTLVHSGRQSMPFLYDNTAGYTVSEATRTLDAAQDWTLGGLQTLVLFFRGEPTNGAGQLYVRINNTQVAYNGSSDALTKTLWKQWNIDLTTLAGAKAVQSFTIGVSGPVKGKLYIDDIRLYQTAPEVPVPVDPGTTGLAAHYAFEGDARDSAGAYHGTALNDPTYADSQAGLGKAIWLDGVNDYVDLPIGPLIGSLTSATVATWVNVDSTAAAGWQRVFDFGTSSTAGYMFLTPSAGTNGVVRFAISRTTSSGESRVTGPARDLTGWHHVAVVIDGQARTLQLCLDGEVVATGATAILPGDLGQTTQNWLGRSQYDADAYLSATLDEFRIYSRALSAAEVLFLAGDR